MPKSLRGLLVAVIASVLLGMVTICFQDNLVLLITGRDESEKQGPPIYESAWEETTEGQINTTYPPSDIESKSTNLVILTYMRSGSSFTGNMFEYDPDVMYVFEPMHEVKWVFKNMVVHLYYLHRRKKKIPDWKAYVRVTTKLAQDIFDCKFDNIDIATLTQAHMERSVTTKKYGKCILKNSGVLNIPKCFPRLVETCKNRKVRVIKTIAYPMDGAMKLIKSSQSTKILHLVRDPRATISSQIHVGLKAADGLIQHLCGGIRDDLRIISPFLSNMSSQYRLVRYEDLCTDPSGVVKSMYDFAGLNFTTQTMKNINSFTSAETNEECPFCTRRSNSSLNAVKWRNTIDMELLKKIDTFCGDLYDRLGYVQTNDEKTLRDLSIPLIKEFKGTVARF